MTNETLRGKPEAESLLSNMRKLVAAVAVAIVAGTSLAGYVVDGSTITFTVGEGVVETNDMALTAAYTKFVKEGAGTLVMTRAQDSANNFSNYNKQRPVEIKAGILRLDVNDSIGAYCNIYISSGAQLYTTYGMGKSYTQYSPLCYLFKSVNGTGPDGTGAIRIKNADNARWNDWLSCFRNEVTLESDATIYVDLDTIIGFNAGSTLDLKGHTLTMAGAGRLYFGNEVNLDKAPPVVTAGNIVNNMTGAGFWIKKGTKFEGTSANVLTLSPSVSTITIDSMTEPFKWKLKTTRIPPNETYIYVYGNLRNGKFDETVNEFAGGMDISGYTQFIAANNPSAANPRAVTISGKVTSIRTDGTAEIACYINNSANNFMTVHLKHANDCGFVFYTGTGVAHVDGAFGRYISLPSNDYMSALPGTARVLLGEGKCSGEYAATVPGIVSAWRTHTTGAGAVDFCCDEDVTISNAFQMATSAVRLIHTGAGRLTLANNVSNLPVEVRATNVLSFAAGIANVNDIKSFMGGKPGVVSFDGTVGAAARLRGAIDVGTTAAFYQNGGTLETKYDSRITGQYGTGFFGLTGGTFNINYDNTTLGAESVYDTNTLAVTSGKSVFQMDGGEVVQNSVRLHMCRGGETDFLMRGGTYTIKKDKGIYFATKTSSTPYAEEQMVFSMVGDSPVFDASAPGAWLSLTSRPDDKHRTIYNLNAGVLKVRDIGTTYDYRLNRYYFNLNGGSIAWSDRNCVWANDRVPRALTIYEKGFTFEDNYVIGTTNRLFITNAGLTGTTTLKLTKMSGRGVAKIELPADMPRTGYTAIAPVRVVTADGDTGWGATASLDFNIAEGTVADELLITCSGNDYTELPTVVAYGPDLKTPYACTVTLTDDDRVPGPFVKTGPGELVLNFGSNGDESERATSPYNTYPGPYIISNGCLMVNYRSNIPTSSKVFVAGGCFRWDWSNTRTVAEFGGYGTFFGSLNNVSNPLTVSTRYNVDAKDLAAGLALVQSTDTYVDDKGVTCTAVGDNVVVGPDCKVKVANPEALDENGGDYLILRQTSIARVPELEEPIEGWRLKLRNRGTELHLFKPQGFAIYIR